MLGLAEAGGAGTTGDPVDAIVGVLVPELLGLPVGETVEGLELATVGNEVVELVVGEIVGLRSGDCEGVVEGLAVGEEVGDTVGD